MEPSDEIEQAGRKFHIDILLILLSILPVLFSFAASVITSDGQWFQRSGSLMVLFAALLEFRQMYFARPYPSNFMFINGKPQIMLPELSLRRKQLGLVALILVIVGTSIWGYGEIPFNHE